MPLRKYNGRKEGVRDGYYKEMLTQGISTTKLMEEKRSA
jgi:hypothetical protein